VVERISKHLLSLTSARIGSQFLQVALVVLLARALGVEEFGVFGLAVTVGSLMGLVVAFGINYMVVREVAIAPAIVPPLLKAGFLARLLLFLPAFLLTLLLAYGAYSFHIQAAIALACLAYAFRVVFEFLCAIFNGLERTEVTARGWLSHQLLLLSLAAIAIFLGARRASEIFLVYILVGSSLSAVLFVRLRRTVHRPARAEPSLSVAQLLRRALPYGLATVGIFLFFTVDTVLISLYLEPRALGLYQASQRALVAVEEISLVTSLAMLPVLSRLHAESMEQWSSLSSAYARYVLMCAVPAGLVVTTLAHLIVNLAYGDSYADAAPVLAVFGFVIPLRILNGALGGSLAAAGRMAVRTRAEWLAAAMQLGLVFYLLPRYGILGAAWGAFIASGIATSQLIWALRGPLLDGTYPEARSFQKTVLSAALAVGVFVLVSHLLSWAGLLLSLLIYLAALLAWGQLGRKEIVWVRQSLSWENLRKL
jgi:O-antigen/teichoic acid export membrane protein